MLENVTISSMVTRTFWIIQIYQFLDMFSRGESKMVTVKRKKSDIYQFLVISSCHIFFLTVTVLLSPFENIASATKKKLSLFTCPQLWTWILVVLAEHNLNTPTALLQPQCIINTSAKCKTNRCEDGDRLSGRGREDAEWRNNWLLSAMVGGDPWRWRTGQRARSVPPTGRAILTPVTECKHKQTLDSRQSTRPTGSKGPTDVGVDHDDVLHRPQSLHAIVARSVG